MGVHSKFSIEGQGQWDMASTKHNPIMGVWKSSTQRDAEQSPWTPKVDSDCSRDQDRGLEDYIPANLPKVDKTSKLP